MASDIRGLLEKGQTVAKRLTPLQKIALGAVTLTAVAGTLVLTRAGSAPSMSPIYTDLSATDASAVVDELTSRGVSYELTDAGHTVLVPSTDVYDLRVSLAGAGLPASNEGYALLDKQGITTSEFRQRIDYQRALEGELAMTLGAMAGIESAAVHLALPEESVFVDEPSNPTASVLVVGKGTGGISGDEVQAIVHLVSSSVKNMLPEDVTVVDADGVVLSADGVGSSGSGGGGGGIVDDYEQDLAATITALLARTTGANKVAVTVNADLDLDQIMSTSENYGPIGTDTVDGQVLTERVSTEAYGEAAAAAETGILGPDGAVVASTVPTGSIAPGGYQQEDAERTFALDRVVEQVTKAPGGVQRLHVAVLLDDVAVTEAQAAEIEKVVTAAAGIDASRGDSVVVSRVPFDVSAAEEATQLAAAAEKAQKSAEMMQLIRTLAIVFVIIIALLLAYRSARRARKVTATPINIGEITMHHPAAAELASTTASPSMLGLADRNDATMHEISEIATRRPDEVANVLRAWLAESKVRQ